MRKALGSAIFVVVVAAIVAGVAYSLNYFARMPAPTHVAHLTTNQGDVYVVHEDVFPFNTCTSDPSNPDVDAPFVALHPRYAQCSSSHDNYNWVYYSDPIINVPTNAVVEMEIYNYDSATPILNNYYTQPQGVNNTPGGISDTVANADSAINVYFPQQTVTTDKQGNTTQTLGTSATDQVTSQGIGTQTVPVTNIPANGNGSVPGTVVPCPGNTSTCYAAYQPGVVYGPGSGNSSQANVDPYAVSHTFVIHGIASGSQPYLYVSVPILGAQPANPTDQNPTPPPADAATMSVAPIITTFYFRTPSTPGHYVWQCFDPCGANYNGFGGPMSTKGYMSGEFNVG